MFGSRIPLFKAFGIPIRLDLSWFIIFALLSWSLAVHTFPGYYKDLPTSTYWAMGVVAALGLFASIVIHELSHALVAQRFGISIKGITLFIFGGVAEMEDEPPSAIAELLVAIAGPIASVVIAGVSLVCFSVGQAAGWPQSLVGVLWFLGFINTVLVIFNLIPAFPLDGGRVFRSLLWSLRGDLKWATRTTASIGSAFGLVLIAFGVVLIMWQNWIPGIWNLLVGLFLRGAAQTSYQQLLMRRALEGETVSRFMKTEVHTVSPHLSVEQLVEDYIYRLHHKLYPVLDRDRLIGCVTTRDIHQVPREEWSSRTVGDILHDCDEGNTIAPNEDAMKALGRMSKTGSSRLMVVQNHDLVGIVALKDLLTFISLKIELEEEDEGPRPSARRSIDEPARTRHGENSDLYVSH